MIEMVPPAFWGWCLPQLREQFPQLLFIGEVYQPDRYLEYLEEGEFDYLYDKSGLYDALREVIQHNQSANIISNFTGKNHRYEHRMLRFMENHDEQRIASRYFAGEAAPGVPAMAVSALLHNGPAMLYFGQELGEPAQGAAGFSGDDGRTTIFDYWQVPSISRWWNEGALNPDMLLPQEQQLLAQYKKLFNLASEEEVFKTGESEQLQQYNLHNPHYNSDELYSFLRYNNQHMFLVVVSFEKVLSMVAKVILPAPVVEAHLLPQQAELMEYMVKRQTIYWQRNLATTTGVQLVVPPLGILVVQLK
jgi:hypothetical protein